MTTHSHHTDQSSKMHSIPIIVIQINLLQRQVNKAKVPHHLRMGIIIMIKVKLSIESRRAQTMVYTGINGRCLTGVLPIPTWICSIVNTVGGVIVKWWFENNDKI